MWHEKVSQTWKSEGPENCAGFHYQTGRFNGHRDSLLVSFKQNTGLSIFMKLTYFKSPIPSQQLVQHVSIQKGRGRNVTEIA